MAKQRMYEPYWQRLKAAGVIKVEITTSNEAAIQRKLARTLRKAMQKEKYVDINFRSLYPNAVLETELSHDGKVMTIKLDKGLTTADNSVGTLFGKVTGE